MKKILHFLLISDCLLVLLRDLLQLDLDIAVRLSMQGQLSVHEFCDLEQLRHVYFEMFVQVDWVICQTGLILQRLLQDRDLTLELKDLVFISQILL